MNTTPVAHKAPGPRDRPAGSDRPAPAPAAKSQAPDDGRTRPRRARAVAASAKGSKLTAPQSTVTTRSAPAWPELPHRLDARAIAFGHAVGNADQRLAPHGGQIFAEQRRRAGAVDVVIAEDGDPLAALDRAREPLRRRPHVGERQRIGHEVAQRRLQMPLDRLELDAAPGQDAGDEFAAPADLRDRLRPRLPRRVEPRPPAAPGQRRLDVEEKPAHRRIGGRASTQAPPRLAESTAAAIAAIERRPSSTVGYWLAAGSGLRPSLRRADRLGEIGVDVGEGERHALGVADGDARGAVGLGRQARRRRAR